MTSGPDFADDPAWSMALLSMLHPVQIATVEAFAFIDQPMSALIVYEVLGRCSSFGTVAYHVRRLADTGAPVERYVEPVRGAHEHFYGLAR